MRKAAKRGKEIQKRARRERKVKRRKVKDLLVDKECVGVEVVNRVAGIWVLLAGNALLGVGNAREKGKMSNRVNWNFAATTYREPKWGENGYLNLNRPT